MLFMFNLFIAIDIVLLIDFILAYRNIYTGCNISKLPIDPFDFILKF